MRTHSRTPQQRDRRLARVRRLTQTVFVGSGVVSGVMVGFISSDAKPPVLIPVTVPSTTTTTEPAGTTTTTTRTSPTTTTTYTAPTPAPTTTTTVCYSKPSGGVTCS
ncbi:MAG: hypothetical protein ABSE75_05380 [Acidimicrobiales bacterium]|jgi:hypothetical protein